MKGQKSIWNGVAALGIFSAAFAMGLPAHSAPSGDGSSLSTSNTKVINPAESFEDGVKALDEGDYVKAEEKFGEVLAAAPDHAQANYYMGVAKLGRGKTKSSRRYFERAVKEQPNFIDAREKLAIVYAETGKTDDAEEQLEAMKDLQAKCAEVSCDAASIIEESIARVEAAMAGEGEESAMTSSSEKFAGLFLQPREAGVDHYRAAVRLINEERFDEAIADLEQSQAIVGPHPDILNYLGFAHRKMGDMQTAQKYYRQALALDPDHRGANEYLGELYLEIGEIEKAREQLARLDRICAFGCAEREDLARLVEIAESTRSARAE